MPKKVNLTANNVRESYGWMPRVHEQNLNLFIGGADMYSGRREEFNKILKDNFQIDLEADPRDAAKRLILNSGFAQSGLISYLENMQKNALMPDCKEKYQKAQEIADDFSRTLFHEVAKHRLLIIAPGETEPRQIRLDPSDKKFVVSEPLSKSRPQDLDDKYQVRDESGNIRTWNINERPEVVREPRPWIEERPKAPVEVGDFKGEDPGPLRPFPNLRKAPERPVMPKDILEGTTREKLVEQLYQEKLAKANLKDPSAEWISQPEEPAPFVKRPPEKVDMPSISREEARKQLNLPVKPAGYDQLEELEREMENLEEPVFRELPPVFDLQKYTRMAPNPGAFSAEEPMAPVYSYPLMPKEPDYQMLPEKPLPPHMTEPVLIIREPDIPYPTKPLPLEEPEFPDSPDQPELRPEPVPPVRPGFWSRLFTNANTVYQQELQAYNEDHAAWEQERDALPERMEQWENNIEQWRLQVNERINQYDQDARAKADEWKTYNENLAEYEKQVDAYLPENMLAANNYQVMIDQYRKMREELGPRYDADMQKYEEDVRAWEEKCRPVNEANNKLREAYESSPEYREYVRKRDWFEKNYEPYTGDRQKEEELKTEFDARYNQQMAEYTAARKMYDQQKKVYDESVARARQNCEVLDSQAHGNDPDFEEKKEERIRLLMAENERYNAEYPKLYDDYQKRRMDFLSRENQEYEKKLTALMDRRQELKDLHPEFQEYESRMQDYEDDMQYQHVDPWEKYDRYVRENGEYEEAKKAHEKQMEDYRVKYEAYRKQTVEGYNLKVKEYYDIQDDLHRKAEEEVDAKIKENRDLRYSYDERLHRFYDDERDYNRMKANAETDYSVYKYNWQVKTEEYRKLKEEYQKDCENYRKELEEYPKKVADYEQRYQAYLNKLTKWENDQLYNEKLNEIVDSQEQAREDEKEAWARNINKDPKMDEYYHQKEIFGNGHFQWGVLTKDSKVIANWKKENGRAEDMDKYFDEHEARMKRYASSKKNAKEAPSAAEQKAYQERVREETLLSKYPPDKRPLFKKLYRQETALDEQTIKADRISADTFRKNAVTRMYLERVRTTAERQAFSEYGENKAMDIESAIDKDRMISGISAMLNDKALMKKVDKYMQLSNEDKANMKNLNWNETTVMKQKLKANDKLKSIFDDHYTYSNKLIKDPVLNEYHGPAKDVEKAVHKQNVPVK